MKKTYSNLHFMIRSEFEKLLIEIYVVACLKQHDPLRLYAAEDDDEIVCQKYPRLSQWWDNVGGCGNFISVFNELWWKIVDKKIDCKIVILHIWFLTIYLYVSWFSKVQHSVHCSRTVKSINMLINIFSLYCYLLGRPL